MWLFKLRRLLKTAGREALILYFAVRNPATPRLVKIAAIALLAYVVSPIDIVPDIPLIGWLDDALLVSVGLPMLLRRLPPRVFRDASGRAESLIARWRLRRQHA